MVFWHRTRERSGADRAVSRPRPARIAIVAGALAAACVLAGCTPGAAPKPTPTPLFASEAEAYKAAEKVYRDYNAASNSRRNGGQGSDPQTFLAGQALEDDVSAQRKFKEKGIRVVGDNVITEFRGSNYVALSEKVVADLCTDVSRSKVVDDTGTDVTPSDRSLVVPIRVEFTGLKGALKITKAGPGEATCER